MIYEDRSDSEKRGIEEKQKIIVLLISANKCFLCSGIHFYGGLLKNFCLLFALANCLEIL